MKQRIKEIIKELKQAEEEVGVKGFWVSNDMIFDKAISIYLTEITNNNKKFIKKEEITKPATDKQLAYAQQLADKKNIKINITGHETTKQISKLIEELKK